MDKKKWFGKSAIFRIMWKIEIDIISDCDRQLTHQSDHLSNAKKEGTDRERKIIIVL